MAVHLGPECPGDVFRAVHDLSALIVQAQHRLTLRNEGLLLHTRLGTQRPGYVVQIPHLVPLVCGKGCFPFCQGRIFPQARLKLKGIPQRRRQGFVPFGGSA